ncbi:MAG: OmpA family protein [Sulfuricurvum sp.]
MKKIILSSLIAATLVSASDFNYEVTPLAGYLWNKNIVEKGDVNSYVGGTGSNNNLMYGTGGVADHAVFGIEAQANNLEVFGIKPELSMLYGTDTITGAPRMSKILTTMIDGVYDINTGTMFTPFAKAGFGYEIEYGILDKGLDGFLLNAGMGTKIDLSKNVAFKVEGLYFWKDNNGRNLNGVANIGQRAAVNNYALLAGFTFKLDEKAAPYVAPVVVAPVVVPEPVVAAPVDSDHDGVFDPQDKCPNTPAGFKVDKDGCEVSATLRVNFASGSAKIVGKADKDTHGFSDFLKVNAYKGKIVGYTDNVGKAPFNKKLSLKRANAVKAVLVKDGIAADRLTTEGKGMENPVASNKTKAGRAQNRRIEVEISK